MPGLLRQLSTATALLIGAPILGMVLTRALQASDAPVALNVWFIEELLELWPVFAAAAAWRALSYDSCLYGRARWGWRAIYLALSLAAASVAATHFAPLHVGVLAGALGPFLLGLVARGRSWRWRLPASAFTTLLLTLCMARAIPWLGVAFLQEYSAAEQVLDAQAPEALQAMAPLEVAGDPVAVDATIARLEQLAELPAGDWRYIDTDDRGRCDPRNRARRVLAYHYRSSGDVWAMWLNAARLRPFDRCGECVSGELEIYQDTIDRAFWPGLWQLAQTTMPPSMSMQRPVK